MNDTRVPEGYGNIEPQPFEKERETGRSIVHALAIVAIVFLVSVASARMTTAG